MSILLRHKCWGKGFVTPASLIRGWMIPGGRPMLSANLLTRQRRAAGADSPHLIEDPCSSLLLKSIKSIGFTRFRKTRFLGPVTERGFSPADKVNKINGHHTVEKLKSNKINGFTGCEKTQFCGLCNRARLQSCR